MKHSNSAIVGLLIVSLSLISACSSMKIEDVVVTDQPFIVEDYFAGQLRAQGIVMDRGGSPIRYFEAQIDGRWDESSQTLVLDEDFDFADGEQDTRVWTIRREADGRYTGTADDVVGVAEGRQRGNALNWQYTLTIPWRSGTIDLQLDDWMYLMNDTLINRAVMTKFGVRVGEILISFERLD